jgi:hypothetical protein
MIADFVHAVVMIADFVHALSCCCVMVVVMEPEFQNGGGYPEQFAQETGAI